MVIDGNEKDVLTVGEKVTLSASVWADGTASQAVNWKSSDTTVATVDKNGVVTAIAPGEVTISATSQQYDYAIGVAHFEVAFLNSTPEIKYGKEISSHLSVGEFEYYKFVPSKSGKYRIYTTGDISTYISVYKNDKKISVDTQFDNYGNSSLEYEFARGTNYYVLFSNKGTTSAGNYYITIEPQNKEFDNNNYNDLKNELNELLEEKQDILSLYTLNECIDIIMVNDSYITSLCNTKTTSIPKAYMQAILLRELWCVDASDILADEAVIAGEKDDCSTGYGQIFAKTAIGALNNAIALGIEDPKRALDSTNPEHIEQMWNDLYNNQRYNLKMVYYEILNCASNTNQSNMLFFSYDDSQIKQIISRYNGTGDSAMAYGNETYKYFTVFEKYNS